MTRPPAEEPRAVVLRNEFATVRVTPDDRANGPRLRIEDLQTGRSICLDPLELEWIAWSTHDDVVRLLPDGTPGLDAPLGDSGGPP
jgi:hypothetical protein